MKRGSQPTSLRLGRLIWVGPLTVLASIAAVLLVRFTAVALLHPDPTLMPLTMVPAIIDTAILVTFAAFVYHRAVSGRDLPSMLIGVAGRRFFTLDPIPAYRLLAVRALLVSFVPDIAVAFWLRAKWPYAFALAAMHIAAWAVCVPMLTKLTTTNSTQPESDAIPMQPSENAASIYNNRLNERHRSLKDLMRWAHVAGYVRGVMGILIPATLWLGLVPHLVSAWLAVIPAAAFLALHKYYEDIYLKLNRLKRGIEFYEQGIGRIENLSLANSCSRGNWRLI